MLPARTFAIGDVQGCLGPLKALLNKIAYEPSRDTLWFTGDLANRGPEPLATLQFIYSLPQSTICVLGNHDLALLALAAGVGHPHHDDTHQTILATQQREILLAWLRHRPLFHHCPKLNFTLTHAGIFPLWNLEQAKSYASEAEAILQSEHYSTYLAHMYGNEPARWEPSLQGYERFRFILNSFTRMRFLTANGALELTSKERLSSDSSHIPWFIFPERRTQQDRLLFGHWAALQGKCHVPNVYALDTGCVWGKCLTAFCLETLAAYKVECGEYLSSQTPK